MANEVRHAKGLDDESPTHSRSFAVFTGADTDLHSAGHWLVYTVRSVVACGGGTIGATRGGTGAARQLFQAHAVVVGRLVRSMQTSRVKARG